MPSSATTPSPSSMWEHHSANSSSDATDSEDDIQLDFNPMHPSQIHFFRRLIGTWSLEHVVATCSQTAQQVDWPLGSHPKGLLIYSPDGYVTTSLEPSSDAPTTAPSTILYTGPFELARPYKREEESATGRNSRCPDALCYDMLDSSIYAQDIGSILERELKMFGHGPHRTLAMHMADIPTGRKQHTMSLDLQWKREEAFSF